MTNRLNFRKLLIIASVVPAAAGLALFGTACVSSDQYDALSTRVDGLSEDLTALEGQIDDLNTLAASLTEGLGGDPVMSSGGDVVTDPTGDALKIGFLADFSGQLAEFGPAIQTGVELAIAQINAGGGVNGQDVTLATGDTGLNSTMAVSEARRLISVENVHAIVGPLASGISLAVAESVLADAQVPGVSPSATSPSISDASDNDFLFRTAVSDAAQGLVLANNVVENAARSGATTNVGVVYVDNAYGQGLLASFRANFDGGVSAAAYAEDTTSFRSQLQSAGSAGAEALIIIGYAESEQILREALQDELFETYYFVDGNRSEEIATNLGPENLAGFFGTAPGSGPNAFSDFEDAYEAEFGEAVPGLPFIREAYDATIAIALAAASVDGDLTGPAIRDQLRGVVSSPGTTVHPSTESVEMALTLIAGGSAVDYDGLTSTIGWDNNGDISGGFINVWTFAEDGSPQDVETIEITN